jgi:hypothetical protein
MPAPPVGSEMQPTKDEAAKTLAATHYAMGSGISHIFRVVGQADVEVVPSEPIKLLEVNAATIPTGVMPLRFGPAPASGVPYPSVIIEVTPAEYQKIRAQELKLPNGWQIGGELPKAGARGRTK